MSETPDVGVFYRRPGAAGLWVDFVESLEVDVPVLVPRMGAGEYAINMVSTSITTAAKRRGLKVAVRTIGDDIWACRLKDDAK